MLEMFVESSGILPDLKRLTDWVEMNFWNQTTIRLLTIGKPPLNRGVFWNQMANHLLIGRKPSSNKRVSRIKWEMIKSHVASRFQSVDSLKLNGEPTTLKQQSDCAKISNLSVTVTCHMSK